MFYMAEAAVLGRRLGIVTPLTERLMVRRVPEQRLVALVRRDMINNRRLYDQSMTRALCAAGIRCEKRRPVSLPPRPVSAFSRSAALAVVFAVAVAGCPLMHGAVAPRCEFRATGMCAWMWRAIWHLVCSPVMRRTRGEGPARRVEVLPGYYFTGSNDTG